MSAIAVHDLTKSYGDLQVLRGVDFDVARGASSRCSARTARARRLS